MKVQRKRKRHSVPLRAIVGKTGLSLKHVWRIVNKREQYSNSSEQKVTAAIVEIKKEKLKKAA